MKVEPNHPLAELLARKLFGIEGVPPKEQRRMVARAIKAAVEWAGRREANATPKGPHTREYNGHPIEYLG